MLDALTDQTQPSDEQWDREWQLHKLRTALQSIAHEFEPVTLNVFRAHVLFGWSVDETAVKLEVSKSSVYQAKCRVLKRLREQIEEMDREE